MIRSKLLPFRWLLCASAFLLGFSDAFAVPADAGHRPFNSDVPFANPNAGQSATPRRQYREPYVEISNNPASPTTITVYTVIRKLNNPVYGTANQTGGTIFVKGASQNTWTPVPMSFHADEGDFQYWKGSFSSALTGTGANEVLQYYFYLTFSFGAQNTFIYAGQGYGDLASQTAAGSTSDPAAATAASNPFTIRDRPAWIFHANNRVLSGNDVQFWAKVGYIGNLNDAATQWATNGAVYYTTDGSEPTGSMGIGSGATQVAAFTYDHPDNTATQNGGTQSVAGTAMWWAASAPGLLQNVPLGGTIKYRIGFWHTSSKEEKFADHNAGTNNTTFSFTNGTVGDPVLTVNGVNGNYTTTHVFIDETKGESVPFTILFSPGQPSISAVEVYSNLSRRDKATVAYTDANGVQTEEGIEPIDGGNVVAGDDTHYFKAYTMAPAGPPGQYTVTLPANKTGAYRLTARWKVTGDNNWRYYTNIGAGRRDHAIVVSPVTARNINLYEANVFNLDANGTGFANRGTLEDMYDAPNAPHQGSANHWNLTPYLKNLGCNWLWFQPVHPITQEAQQGHDPGSPYSVRNFFEIDPLMSVSNTRTAALGAFQGLVSAANNNNIGIMLDAPFNHTAPDCEISTQGTSLFGNNAGDFFRDKEARFYSRDSDGTGALPANYAMRASGSGSIAIAPDRGDFGKWGDVRDVYFGRYAALVDTNGDGGTPNDNGNYLNEQDWFDYSVGNEGSAGSGNGHFDQVTQNVWKYFSNYTLYWLGQTGVPAGTDLATQTGKGIGGLRADFGQGLPPQLWEYIINKTRTRKWNFVFMAESLDGGAVTYRSNRHFDILNENIVFPLKNATNATDYRNIFESRRSAYGQSPVLMNNMSHDEEAFGDPWQALVRYAVCSTEDGVPLIFPGQELGISTIFGYTLYETNFGKNIADFKDFNSMVPAWNDSNFGNDQLYPVYAAIGQARLGSPALRSPNRYFLNEDGNTTTIFGVAKYETLNASPATGDVIFAFANTNRDAAPSGNFHVNQDIDANGINDYGIKASRQYNVKNIAAYTAQDQNRRNLWLWGNTGRTGSDVLTTGIFIAMNRVPLADSGWSSAPYEAQYLKLYDVTAPSNAPGTPAAPNAYAYSVGNSVVVSWTAAAPDSDGVVPAYKVTYSINGGAPVTVFTSNTNYTINALAGQSVSVTVQSVNPSDNSSTGPASSPATIKFIDPNGDDDNDGMSNAAEDFAGTNPFDPNSNLRIISITHSLPSSTSLTWTSVTGRHYQIESATNPGGPYTSLGGLLNASNGSTTTYVDTTTAVSPSFYRVKVVP